MSSSTNNTNASKTLKALSRPGEHTLSTLSYYCKLTASDLQPIICTLIKTGDVRKFSRAGSDRYMFTAEAREGYLQEHPLGTHDYANDVNTGPQETKKERSQRLFEARKCENKKNFLQSQIDLVFVLSQINNLSNSRGEGNVSRDQTSLSDGVNLDIDVHNLTRSDDLRGDAVSFSDLFDIMNSFFTGVLSNQYKPLSAAVYALQNYEENVDLLSGSYVLVERNAKGEPFVSLIADNDPQEDVGAVDESEHDDVDHILEAACADMVI